MHLLKLFCTVFALILLTACSNSDENNNQQTNSDNSNKIEFNVGGMVSGLSGNDLVLQNNNADDLHISTSGEFIFPTSVFDNVEYDVTIASQPLDQTCSVTNGSGNINGENITNISITCINNIEPTTYFVAGAVSGLTQNGLELQLNDKNKLTITTSEFSFPMQLPDGTRYNVTVFSQPQNQTCSVTNGSGKINGQNITNIGIACIDNVTQTTYSVSVIVSGLTQSGLVLQLNGGSNLFVDSSGEYTFATPLPDKTSYNVTVFNRPLNQTCSVGSGSGNINGANVSKITITCIDNIEKPTYSISGIVSGLTQSGLVLQLNDGNDLPIMTSGVFTFPTPLPSWNNYKVTVVSHPSNQKCSVNYGSGEFTGSNIGNILVNCIGKTEQTLFSVSGFVRGLTQGGLVLQLNGANDLVINEDGPFSFTNLLTNGANYSVSVITQPVDLICSPVNTGTIYGYDINNVLVNCNKKPPESTYKVLARVTGLSGTGLILQVNNSNDLSIQSNGTSTFPAQLPTGSEYNISILSQPSGQICSFTQSSGISYGANAFVFVACTTDDSATSYTISAIITGLEGSGLVLQNNVSDDLNITGNGSFTFSTPIADNNIYSVSIFKTPTQPRQTCTLSNASGTVAGGDVTNTQINCATNYYTVRALVRALSGSGLVLQDGTGEELPIDADGYYIFSTELIDLSPYSVTIKNQPINDPGCMLENSSGTLNGFNPEVSVVCGGGYSVSVDVRGLTGTGLVVQNNGSDNLTINTSGKHTFSTSLWNLSKYNVSISKQPDTSPSEMCGVVFESGQIVNKSVTNVVVVCRTGPTVTNHARYSDSNLNNIIDEGDSLVVPFDSGIVVDGAVAEDLALAVTGDSLGVNATLLSASTAVNVSLGASPKFTLLGDFDVNNVGNGSPSGIDVSENMTPFSIYSYGIGVQAVPSQPITISPEFVQDHRQNRFYKTVNPKGVDLADIDGDGDLDMVIGSYLYPTDIYLNHKGMFTHIQSLGVEKTSTVAFADIDNDGDPDLIEGNIDKNILYLNDGGVFVDSGQTPGAGWTQSIALGDIDNDGDLDLIVGTRSEPANLDTVIFENIGGMYVKKQAVDIGEDVSAVSVGDVEGDGDLDLVIGTDASKIFIFLNDGGIFSDSGQLLNRLHPVPVSTSTALGDMDNDGDLDLVVGNFNFENEIYINNGGTFIRSLQRIGAHSTQVTLADLDNDGDVDIMQSGGRYLNVNGTFMLYGNVSDSNAIAFGDIDNDGDLDIVSANGNVLMGSAAAIAQ